MRKHLLSAALLAAFTLGLSRSSYAQDRENAVLPTISDKVLWSLNSATGWIKGSDGQWIETKNKIQRIGISSADIVNFNKGANAVGEDNFSKYEARDVNVNGREFLLITKTLVTEINLIRSFSEPKREQKVVFVVVEKNKSKSDPTSTKDRPEYYTPIFYYGTVDPSPTYLKSIVTEISKLQTQNPWISTSKGTTLKFNMYYKKLPDPTKSRFLISTSIDGELDKHFFKPALYVFSLDNSPLTEYYFELPTANMSGLTALLGID